MRDTARAAHSVLSIPCSQDSFRFRIIFDMPFAHNNTSYSIALFRGFVKGFCAAGQCSVFVGLDKQALLYL